MAILEEGRHRAREGDIVGNRLDVVLRQRVADLVQRIDDLVCQRANARDRRIVAQLAAGADRPLGLAARNRSPAVHHPAIMVAAEAEVDRQAAVLADDRRPDFLGPALLRRRRRCEGVGDLVVQHLVEADQGADIIHLVTDEIAHVFLQAFGQA